MKTPGSAAKSAGHRPLIQAIGLLESCFREKFGTPRQPQIAPAARAKLKIFSKFSPHHSLKGLEGFSHAWLLTYLHLNTQKMFRPSVHPPRLGGKAVGVFASRSPHRPSPIGLSLVKIEKIAGDTIYFSGTDLVDGTPILDVKPYIPWYDRAKRALGGWAENTPPRSLTVGFAPEALRQIERLESSARPRLKTALGQILRQDPRNPRDRSQLKPDKTHEMRIWDLEVRFLVRGRRAVIESVHPAGPKDYLRPGRVPPEIL
ncbi:MAG TPA: tRNA (N6-threonylcarbamoyladenosine(37)-N6)-methyltransferase TrmO [Elusimicrobiota bacterium]|nr:tRNA (N6-threonylcarbamoyladenosine(37)-N6)-methyltransferase TrmO [Elusimicrobiota bacterium]